MIHLFFCSACQVYLSEVIGEVAVKGRWKSNEEGMLYYVSEDCIWEDKYTLEKATKLQCPNCDSEIHGIHRLPSCPHDWVVGYAGRLCRICQVFESGTLSFDS